jgi:hypothetical protein
MAREFREEAGWPEALAWTQFASVRGDDYEVGFFHSRTSTCPGPRHVTEEGEVTSHHLPCILESGTSRDHSVVPDLAWLIPMALRHLRGRGPKFYDMWQGSGERAPGAGVREAGGDVLERLGHSLQEDLTMRVIIGPGRMETRAIPVEVESCLTERGRPRSTRYAGATNLVEEIGKALDDVQRESRPRSEWADTFRRRP